jgi:DNA helicase-2/ATP-dependent DNA helicase PcrA
VKHLEGLNEAQKEAVTTTEGPLLILAGAGAGKTRVITHRILEIVRKGVAPEHILAITFTNKAAGEMRQRAMKLLLEDRGVTRPVFEPFIPPFISTFHSLGLKLIKENAKVLGFKRTPAIFDRADSLRAMKEALKAVGAEDVEPRAALSFVSRQKGNGVSAGQFAGNEDSKVGGPRDRLLTAAWLSYEHTLAKEGALDFDDLLVRAVDLLREYPEVRAHYQARWRYIHIDEYQDTNRVQAQFVELLVGKEKNICVVGDIDQTIYGWRGADIANMLQFEKKFPGARIIVLEENYRSTKNILAAANEIIAKNIYRREKNLYTKNGDGEPLSLYQAFDETDEAGFVVRKITERMEGDAEPKDFAVLYRANFQSRAVEEAMLNAGIPYQVLGTRFFERKEVKDVLSYIRAALYDTSADIARALNSPPRGIGKVTLLKMLSGREAEITGAMEEKIKSFRNLLAHIKSAAQKMPPSEVVRMIVRESGMERMYKEDKIEGAERLENIRELVSLATRYDTVAESPIEGLEQFLESVSLATDQDELKEEKNAVRLMTVHASKGLEFPQVFIIGLEEGLFPYDRDEESASDREEERRLCYVALTRAQRKVFLTYASYRTVFGSKNATLPSQFLTDIPAGLIELESPERVGKIIYLE